MFRLMTCSTSRRNQWFKKKTLSHKKFNFCQFLKLIKATDGDKLRKLRVSSLPYSWEWSIHHGPVALLCTCLPVPLQQTNYGANGHQCEYVCVVRNWPMATVITKVVKTRLGSMVCWNHVELSATSAARHSDPDLSFSSLYTSINHTTDWTILFSK